MTRWSVFSDCRGRSIVPPLLVATLSTLSLSIWETVTGWSLEIRSADLRVTPAAITR